MSGPRRRRPGEGRVPGHGPAASRPQGRVSGRSAAPPAFVRRDLRTKGRTAAGRSIRRQVRPAAVSDGGSSFHVTTGGGLSMKRFVAALAGAVLAAASGIAPVAAGEKLRIGVEGAYPPFSWKEADGSLKGFDIDVAFALCEKMDREVRARRAGLGRHDPRVAREEVRRHRRLHVDHRGAQEAGRLHRQVLQHAGPFRRGRGFGPWTSRRQDSPERRWGCSAARSTSASWRRSTRTPT